MGSKYNYISDCCNAKGEKPPCIKPKNKKTDYQPLGTWRCGHCKHVCKVRREKVEEHG